MRIGINLLYLLPGVVGGTQTYAQELLRALANRHDPHEYLLFVNEEARDLPLPSSPDFERVVCPVRAHSRSARYQYEQFALPRQLKHRELDVLHSLGYVGPLHAPCRHVVTIHDLNYRAFKGAMRADKRVVLGFFVRQTAHHADHIIAVSQFSKEQIVQHLQVRPNKVTVVHEAARQPEQTHSPEEQNAILCSHGLNAPYVVAFSSQSLNKNIPRLLAAFAQLAPENPHNLVLIGHVPSEADVSRNIARLGLSGRVVCTGYLPDAHIPVLLRHADLFVFPSWYEGFGLPALEAQLAGVPVACSNAASLPEVAGEGAVYFDPVAVEDIARALRQCLNDPVLRARLREQGTVNASRFSWEQAAQDTLEVYAQIARS